MLGLVRGTEHFLPPVAITKKRQETGPLKTAVTLRLPGVCSTERVQNSPDDIKDRMQFFQNKLCVK